MKVDDEIVEAIQGAFETHRLNDHAGLPPGKAAELVVEHEGMVGQLDFLVRMVAGECEVDEVTGVETGHRLPGISSRVERLEHAANGGGGLSMKRSDKVWIAVVTSITTIAVSVLTIVGAMLVLVVR